MTNPTATAPEKPRSRQTATIELPWPPSFNHYWRSTPVLPRAWAGVIGRLVGPIKFAKMKWMFAGKGWFPTAKVLISTRGREYRIDVLAAVLEKWGYLKPLECRLRATYTIYPPDRRTRDLSNLVKVPEDAMTHARVWKDDEQIDHLTVIRGPVEGKPGRLVVTFEEIPQERLD